MSSASYQTRKPNTERRQNNTEWSPFDDLATEYDAWFNKDGSLIFFMEVQAFRELLPASSAIVDTCENALDNFFAKGGPFRHSELLECV